LTETHPPTPSDLIAGIGHVEGMLSDMIKVCERVTSQDLIFIQYAYWLAQRNSRGIPLHEAQDPNRIWTQATRSWKL
jgi:hypothetical protein